MTTTVPAEKADEILATHQWVSEQRAAGGTGTRVQDVLNDYHDNYLPDTTPAGQRHVFSALVKYTGLNSNTGVCIGTSVGSETLAAKTGISRVTIRKHLAGLKASGQIYFSEQSSKGGRSQVKVCYFLLPNRPAAAAAAGEVAQPEPAPVVPEIVEAPVVTAEPVAPVEQIPGILPLEGLAPPPAAPATDKVPSLDKRRAKNAERKETTTTKAREAYVAAFEQRLGSAPSVNHGHLGGLIKNSLLKYTAPHGFDSIDDAVIAFMTWAGDKQVEVNFLPSKWQAWANGSEHYRRVGYVPGGNSRGRQSGAVTGTDY